jgi:uncharacterized protein YndB with AHSA1/START domain
VLAEEGGSVTSASTRPGRTIQKEIVIAAAPEHVYRALLEPEQLQRWFAAEVTLEARIGGRFRYHWGSGEHVDGVIVDLVPARLLVMDWDEGEGKGDTRVTIELIPDGDGTRLLLTNSGFGTGDDWDALYDGVDSGWNALLTALNAWLVDGVANPTR